MTIRKRIASTSRLAFLELQPGLQPRECKLLEALREHIVDRGEAPTAYELLVRLRAAHPGYDPNSVRPRLTSLRDKGLIIGDSKRRCRVTGRLAWTWAPTADVDPTPAPRQDAATSRHQPALDLGWAGGGAR